MALAGMTTRGGLFVLETLAADHRMLVVYRGTHEASRNGGVRHVLSGPARLIARATAHSTAPFWERLGRAMNECPPGGRRMTEPALRRRRRAWQAASRCSLGSLRPARRRRRRELAVGRDR